MTTKYRKNFYHGSSISYISAFGPKVFSTILNAGLKTAFYGFLYIHFLKMKYQ